MKTASLTTSESSLAKPIAAEDLCAGQDVAVLHELHEVPSFFWCQMETLPPDELVRLRALPRDSGLPLKVRSVCLPFVLVDTPTEGSRLLDTRRLQLVRLDREFARQVRKKLRDRKSPVPSLVDQIS
ncbi:MAG: hypothetical protein KF774_09800 [Planctomyces sp.]|nr:hypothetical protein [Planctomyces sp.]